MWSAVERRVVGACDAVMTVNPSIAAELKNATTFPRSTSCKTLMDVRSVRQWRSHGPFGGCIFPVAKLACCDERL